MGQFGGVTGNARASSSGQIVRKPQNLVLYAATNTTVRVFVEDANETTLDATGAGSDVATITVGTTAKSLAQFLAAAGYYAAGTTVPGFKNGATNVYLQVVSGEVFYNFSGTDDGGVGAGNGIEAGRPAPGATSRKMTSGKLYNALRLK